MGPVDLQGISGQAGFSVQSLPEQAVAYQLRDAPAGYRPLPGYPKWQVVQDTACPWDPAVVRAMRELDPSIVPMWVQWVYAPPADQSDKTPFVTGRHAVGWHRPDLPPQEFHALMPLGKVAGMHFQRPTRIWKIYHESKGTSDRIGGFVPWSWWMYHNLREEFCENGRRRGVSDQAGEAYWSMRKYNLDKEAYQVRQQRAHRDTIADMDRETAPFIKKALEHTRPLDWKLWQAGGWKQAQESKKTMLDMKAGQGLPLPLHFSRRA